MNQDKKKKLEKELLLFQNIWHDGFYTGYQKKRNQKGLEKYLKKTLKKKKFREASLLEIGSGGGQWTKFIYDLKIFDKIYCIDALSSEHNKFWEYLGSDSKKVISYFKVEDFSLDFINDNSLDYVFSYDTFCHISLTGTEAYLESLSKKCKDEADILIMYADPEKYLKSEPENRDHLIAYLPEKKSEYEFDDNLLIQDALSDSDSEPLEPRWYWLGEEKYLEISKKYNFKVVNADLNIDKTNPITLLQK